MLPGHDRQMRPLILIAHNIRSCHNAGSLLRTAEGLGVIKVYLTGYTPYPLIEHGDTRLPHLAQKIDRQINKTALGATQLIAWENRPDIEPLISELRSDGFTVAALEQTAQSLPLPDVRPGRKMALIVGREVEGIEPEVLARCDCAIQIPMYGRKESFNVAAAAAMALYRLRFH